MTKKCSARLSNATFFRHDAVLSLPAVLLCKLPNSSHNPAIYPLKEYQSVLKLLSVNLLSGIATNHYHHWQIISRRIATLNLSFRIMEQHFLMVEFKKRN